jgi:ribosome-binding protein aMBF1 (putative translation factor)
MSINSEIGQIIYDARIKAGLSQDELGTLIGVSANIIDDLELADKSNYLELFSHFFP